MGDWNPDEVRLQIAKDLTAVVQMFADLPGEAINRAGDPDIPGGAAMVMLGPGRDVEAFGYMELSAIMGRIDPHAVEEVLKSDLEPPLSFLASWADLIREERGQEPSQRRATIKREATYLRSALDWMTATNDDGEPWFLSVDDFATQLGKTKRELENVLRAGDRADRIRAECKDCTEAPRLCLRRGEADDGSQDHWYCPACHSSGDQFWVARCWRQMLVKRGDAPEWMPLRAAAASVGRPVSTVRTWTLPPDRGDGNPKRDEAGNPLPPMVESEKRSDGLSWVRWADVRAIDDTTLRRGRNRFIA